MEAGHQHILNGQGFVELIQDGANLVDEIMPNSAGVILLEEPFKTLMSKSDYHTVL